MSASITQKPTQSALSASIKDHALLLYLPHAEPQSLWRFDLDGLTEHAFCVTARDGYYDLSIASLDGEDHVLTRFLDKQDARDALNTIHTILGASAPCCTKGSCGASSGKGFFGALFGWVTFWRLLFLIVLGIVLFSFMSPATHAPIQAAEQKATPPSGVPLDADALLE